MDLDTPSGGFRTLSRLEGSWRELWGSGISRYRELANSAASYLTYLQEHQQDLWRLLSVRGIFSKPNPTRGTLDYVAWATLGIHLVEGYRWLGELPPEARRVLRSAAESLSSTRDWGKDALAPLHTTLRPLVHKPSKLRPAAEFAEAHSALYGAVTGRSEVPFGDAYVLGVMTGRELGDPPPPCTVSAANIITRGIVGFYERVLLEAVKERPRSRESQDLRHWLRLEQVRRTKLLHELIR